MNAPGYSDVLIGLQYGDEGKAKIIDRIAGEYNVIARFNGGANAGHTVKTDASTVALKQVPSGIFNENVDLYIGSGCAVNAEKLVTELEQIDDLGVSVRDRLRISDQATLIQPHHILLDSLAGGSVGTTYNGIGPAYADRCMRMFGERMLHVRLGDVLDDCDGALRAIAENLQQTCNLYGIDGKDMDEKMQNLRMALDAITPLIERDTLYLQNRVRNGCTVLFEGAQSFMLDVGRGTAPYVTSSHTGAGSPYVGGDISPEYHRMTIGVAKALMSRVGNGPFASEFGGKKSEEYCMEEGGTKNTRSVEESLDTATLLRSEDPFEMGIALRKLSNEYGTGTGRPRRIGMLDLVQLSYAIRLNGVTNLYINKCDLLREFSDTNHGTIPVVTSYNQNSVPIDYVPGTTGSHRSVECYVEQRPGFSEDVRTVRSRADMPTELVTLLEEIEHRVGCSITGIGVGPDRKDHVVW